MFRWLDPLFEKLEIIVLVLFIVLLLTILPACCKEAHSDQEHPPAQWIVRSYWEKSREGESSSHIELAIQDYAGNPRLIIYQKNENGDFESKLILNGPPDLPWFRLGLGGTVERKLVYHNQARKSELYFTLWYDDRIQLNPNWSLRSEVELQCWIKEWGEVALIAHQIFLGCQAGSMEIGPILAGKLYHGNDYLAAGLKLAYPEDWFELSVEGLIPNDPKGPELRATVALIF